MTEDGGSDSNDDINSESPSSHVGRHFTHHIPCQWPTLHSLHPPKPPPLTEAGSSTVMLRPRRQHLESKAACSVTRPLRGRGRPCPHAQFQAFNHSTGCLATKQFPRRWRNLNVFPSLLVWQSWAAGWNTSTPWLFPLVHRRPQCRRGAQPSSPVLQWSQSGRRSTEGHLKRRSSIPCFTAQSGASTQLYLPQEWQSPNDLRHRLLICRVQMSRNWLGSRGGGTQARHPAKGCQRTMLTNHSFTCLPWHVMLASMPRDSLLGVWVAGRKGKLLKSRTPRHTTKP